MPTIGRREALMAGAVAGLVAAAAEVAVSTIGRPALLRDPAVYAIVLLCSTFALVTAYSAAWLTALPLLRRQPEERRAALHVFAVAALVLLPCIYSMRARLGVSTSHPLFVALPLVVLASLWMAIPFYGLGRWLARPGSQPAAASLTLASPWLALTAATAGWLYLAATTAGSTARYGVLLVAGFVWTAVLLLSHRHVRSSGRPRAASFLAPSGCWLALLCVLAFWPDRVRIERAPPAPSAPRHIILVVIDTLRRDALPIYSESAPPTPAISRFAKDAVLFQRAVSPAPWTRPAVTSLLTGLLPEVHGATGTTTTLPQEAVTLAERMQAAGYRTAAIGRNAFLLDDHPGAKPWSGTLPSGISQGFDEYHFYPRGDTGRSIGALVARAVMGNRLGSRPGTPDLARQAIRWVRDNAAEPFFLWLHFLDPHLPYTPPLRLVPSEPPSQRMRKRFSNLKGVRSGHFVPTLEEMEWLRTLYLAEVQYVDQHLGHFFDELRSLGIYHDALIVLTSDHGEEFGEHDGFEHGHTVYQEQLAVPLLVKPPRSQNSVRIGDLVSIRAIPPTILEAVGLEPEAQLGELAPLPLQANKHRLMNDTLLISSSVLYYEPQVAVRFGDYKYIWREYTGKEELYDLSRDPGEVRNLLAFSPELTARARAHLEVHRAHVAEERARLAFRYREHALRPEQLEALRSLGYLQ